MAPQDTYRRLAAASLVAALALACAPPAAAQLDPLLFMKRVPPTVIVVMDTSFSMLTDGEGNYYDPYVYSRAGDAVADALGLPAGASTYRRMYRDLEFESVQGASSKYIASTIVGVPNTAASYATFYAPTRFEIAKSGIQQAVDENPVGPRWGLIKLRQTGPAYRAANNCDRPVRITGNAALAGLNDPCAGGTIGIYAPTVTAANTSSETLNAGRVFAVSTASTNATSISALLARTVGDSAGLVPAGLDAADYEDRPITHALEDARQQAIDAMTADTTCRPCRNTIVVLVTGGSDNGTASYRGTHNAPNVASTFRTVTASGTSKRVPVYVVAIRPDDGDESQLRQIASNSGGQYFEAERAADVTRAINLAVQAAYGRPADFDLSRGTEFLPINPVIGTVNLEGAEAASGSTLPEGETDITTPQGAKIPIRSNVMITAGYAVGGAVHEKSPGFDGRIRAFRSFKPVADSTKPAGYKFVKDGTPLWPDRDGRPEFAGLARPPANPNDRNVYTFVPGSGIVTFDTGHATALQPHLGVSGTEAVALIAAVRERPIGAIIGSTPALMDPPSLDPPPDSAYGYHDSADTYAGDHKDRRALLFFGANDGMIHAVDARTGYEVWAFIPFNLLPKLRTLADGQPVDTFDYFVDSSPKIAEVKMSGQWRSLLLIGESLGGTFYQTFDVTEAGMDGPAPDSDDYESVIATFRDPERIKFLWSFPSYSNFDTTYKATFTLTDGWPGGKITFYGELKASADASEKSVGFSWSDPAVGPLNDPRSVNVAILGSGYFPAVTLPNRTGDQAGRTLYLLDLATGRPLGNPGSCSTGASGTGCLTVPDVSGDGRKNALQADPTAAGVPNGTYITKAYLGDVDGTYWRFDFTAAGQITKTALLSPRSPQPIYASSALMLVGSLSQYVFFGTGSDLLPTSTSGGDGPFTLYGLLDQGSTAVVKLSQPLTPTTSGKNGPLASVERPSTSPSVAGDIVFFTTTTETYGASACTDFASRLYAFTYQGGAAYDTNASGSVTKGESPVVKTMAGRATAPFVVDQHLYIATTGNAGANIEAFGDPEDFNNGVGQVGVRILSWRELR